MGQVVCVTERDGAMERMEYDEAGSLKEFINAAGAATVFEYTRQGQLSASTDALGRRTGWQHDANGNVTQRTDAKGQAVEYEADEGNRPRRVEYPDGSGVEFGYEPGGRLQELVDSTGATRWRYDARGRLTQVTDGANRSVGYEYDRRGNRTAVKYPGGQVVRYEYDALNRLTNVTDWAGRRYGFEYDGSDRLSGVRYPNGVSARYDYDALGRMTHFVYLKNNQPLLRHAIIRDGRGQKVQEEVLAGLSPALQALEKEQIFDPANQLSQSGAEVLTHDRNGNLLAASASETLAFDYENRLILRQSSGVQRQYIYNGLGDRVGRSVDGAAFHDLLDYGAALKNVLVEYDGQGQPQRRFIWGQGLLALVLADGTVRYAHADDMGNILALTDENGQVTDEYAYDLYGQAQIRTPPGRTPTPNPYQFNGAQGVWHEGDGLYHMKARYYSAGLKRFLTPDPKGLEGGHNLYEFAESNPQSFMDPFGLCAESGSSWGRPLEYTRSSSLFSRGYQGVKSGLSDVGSLFDMAGDGSFRGFQNDPQWLSTQLNVGSTFDGKKELNALQTMLSLGGLMPIGGEWFDAANSLVSTARGKFSDALLDAASAVGPISLGLAGRLSKASQMASWMDRSSTLISSAYQSSRQAIRNTVGYTARGMLFGEVLPVFRPAQHDLRRSLFLGVDAWDAAYYDAKADHYVIKKYDSSLYDAFGTFIKHAPDIQHERGMKAINKPYDTLAYHWLSLLHGGDHGGVRFSPRRSEILFNNIFLTMDGDRVVGALDVTQVRPFDSYIWIHFFESIKRGAGTYVIRQMADAAMQNQYKGLRLFSMAQSESFYTKLGFEKVRMPGDYEYFFELSTEAAIKNNLIQPRP